MAHAKSKTKKPARKRAARKFILDMHKLQALRGYVSQQRPDLPPEAVDLIVWRSDLEAYARAGKPITGATWIKEPYGVRPTGKPRASVVRKRGKELSK